MSVDYLDRDAFIAKFADNDPDKMADVRIQLQRQQETYTPDGWVMVQCADLNASWSGQLNIVPFGPHNTWKEIPKGPVSPRGLASDTSVVVAVCLVDKGDKRAE